METIAVDKWQRDDIRREAKQLAKRQKKRLGDVYKQLPIKLKQKECGGVQHFVVRVKRGIRKKAGILHTSTMRVKLNGYPRGVSCYMGPGPDVRAEIEHFDSSNLKKTIPRQYVPARRPMVNAVIVRRPPQGNRYDTPPG